jgi:hypothetical protein
VKREGIEAQDLPVLAAVTFDHQLARQVSISDAARITPLGVNPLPDLLQS